MVNGGVGKEHLTVFFALALRPTYDGMRIRNVGVHKGGAFRPTIKSAIGFWNGGVRKRGGRRQKEYKEMSECTKEGGRRSLRSGTSSDLR